VNEVSSLSIAATPTHNLHAAGTRLLRQQALLRVHARHQGAWGNMLRISVRPSSTLSTTVVNPVNAGDSPVTLGASFGLSAGSVLQFTRGGNPVLRQRVAGVDIATN